MTFLTSLSAKANNVCGAKNKKTVCPDHVIDAMIVSSSNKYSQVYIETKAPSNSHLILGDAPEPILRKNGKSKAHYK